MATHFKGPLVGSSKLFGGGGENLDIIVARGENDLVTAFDDFNWTFNNETFGDAGFEGSGWVLTDLTVPVNDNITMNSLTNGAWDSCLRINPGSAADHGGSMKLDPIASTTPFTPSVFPHIWIPDNTTTSVLDNTVLTFACRIGLVSSAATFDGKAYIGFAETGDLGVLALATGNIAQAEDGPLLGFHINGDSRGTQGIFGVAQRTVGTTYAEGTNRTALYSATATNTGHTANIASWYDLALRMVITDSSDPTNGRVHFYKRRPVQSTTTQFGNNFDDDEGGGSWVQHSTVLLNQTPHNNARLVPHIEVINPAAGAGTTCDLLVDWWAFGMSRYSRTGRG